VNRSFRESAGGRLGRAARQSRGTDGQPDDADRYIPVVPIMTVQPSLRPKRGSLDKVTCTQSTFRPRTRRIPLMCLQEVTLDQGSRPDQLDRQSLSTFRGEVAPWLVREKQAAKIGPGRLRPESKREPLYIQSESRLRAMRIQKYDHSDGQARADVSAPPRARLNIRPAPFDPPLDVDLCRHYLPLLIALWHSSPLSASASVRLRFPRSGRVA